MKSMKTFAILTGSAPPLGSMYHEQTRLVVYTGVPCRLPSSDHPGPTRETQSNGRALLLRRMERQEQPRHEAVGQRVCRPQAGLGMERRTLEIMRKQIDYCANHGIAFWAFDWYWPEGKSKTTPLNNALQLYLQAPNCRRLQFCLLVANHQGFRIGPKDWDACCEKWIELFRQPSHLKLDGQPLLIFFSPEELQKVFGGVTGVRQALDLCGPRQRRRGCPACRSPLARAPGIWAIWPARATRC